jgi:hypothetical protein
VRLAALACPLPEEEALEDDVPPVQAYNAAPLPCERDWERRGYSETEHS